jgi:aldehyde dehydrogenase (NAD+)
MASDTLPRYEHWIDGTETAPASGQYLPTEDPFSGQVWATIARGDAHDARRAVDSARRAFVSGPWPKLTPSERGRRLWKLGDLIVAHADHLAAVEQGDNGKLVAEVRAQVRYMGDYFRYYAGLADKIQSSVLPTDKAGVFAYTRYEPRESSRSSRRGTPR